jgi:uncharacterized protein YndB with AHSA1/START domain
MEKDEMIIKVAIQVKKAMHDVFEAIVDPEKMSQYFISASTGRMEAGKEVHWSFPEFEGSFPVQVDRIEKDKFISFHWDMNKIKHLVEITLSKFGEGSTVITITEKSAGKEKAGLDWLKGNTEGWTNFLAFLKAYLEYSINLRTGAFEFRREEFKEKNN